MEDIWFSADEMGAKLREVVQDCDGTPKAKLEFLLHTVVQPLVRQKTDGLNDRIIPHIVEGGGRLVVDFQVDARKAPTKDDAAMLEAYRDALSALLLNLGIHMDNRMPHTVNTQLFDNAVTSRIPVPVKTPSVSGNVSGPAREDHMVPEAKWALAAKPTRKADEWPVEKKKKTTLKDLRKNPAPAANLTETNWETLEQVRAKGVSTVTTTR